MVKETVQLSKDTLEKIDKARSEGLYHEVRALLTEASDGEEGGKSGRYVNRKGETAEQVVFPGRRFLAHPSIIVPVKGVFAVSAQPKEICSRRANVAGSMF